MHNTSYRNELGKNKFYFKNMENQEKSYKPKDKLTSEELEELIFGDYPQHAPLYVLTHLNMVACGDWNEDQFFEKTKLDYIKNISQYINRWCDTRGLEHPDKLSEKVISSAKIIDGLVTELKDALTRKDELKNIYGIVRRFETEAGIRSAKIPYFEK